VALAAAAPPVWRSADYVAEVDWTGGRLAVRLELADVSPRDPIRLAYLEHLRVEPLTLPAAGHQSRRRAPQPRSADRS
jgi:hypothetical protein